MQRKNRKARASEAATDLTDWAGTVGCYQVVDIDKFFEVYELNQDEQEAVRERWNYDHLYVYQDGSAIWDTGEVLTAAMDQPLNEEAFRVEAEAAGSTIRLTQEELV